MTDAPKTIWARQTSGWGGLERGVYQNSEIDGIPYTLTSSVQAQLKAAVLAEREACARLVEELWAFRTCREVADAIRSKQKEDSK